jgi:hypothetical protein
LRKLFQEAEIACPPGQESVAANLYLEKLKNLAADISGAAPKPQRGTRPGGKARGLRQRVQQIDSQIAGVRAQLTALDENVALTRQELEGYETL